MCRNVRSGLGPIFFALSLLLSFASARSHAEEILPPSELTAGQLASVSADREVLDGPFPGLLLTVREHDPIPDTRYRQLYHATCCVYSARKSSGAESIGSPSTLYSRRFEVHVPDAEALPTARRVAKMLLLLHGEMQQHLRWDHPGRFQTVSVWLTRRVEHGLSPDTAGEQFKDQIYFYNLFAARRPIEWAREIAHEYGHFAFVPGPVGFTAPEDDANGVLGERILLKWLAADLHTKRLSADALPFLTPDQLDTYLALQVSPLLRRFAREGCDPSRLARRDMEGMDACIGLLLSLDSLYGSRQFQDIRACSMPLQEGDFLHSQDFVRGTLRSLREAPDLVLHPMDFAGEGTVVSLSVYLPKGTYAATATAGLSAWSAASPNLQAKSQALLVVGASGWHRIGCTLSKSADASTVLRLNKIAK